MKKHLNHPIITAALLGNPNVGKSTIFNILTGAKQYVGNYPGVTVDKTIGIRCYKNYDIHFVDLPGIYSLSSCSEDAKITSRFLLYDNVDIIINVMDASNLERNFYLFTQIIELNKNIIIILNMLDILKSQHKTININKMSALLGTYVFPVIATNRIKNKDNINIILDYILDIYKKNSRDKKYVMPVQVDYGEDIIGEIGKVSQLLIQSNISNKISKNWLMINLLENNPSAIKLINLSNNKIEILKQIERSRNHIIEHFNTKIEVEIANRRYGFARAIVKMIVNKKKIKTIDYNEIIDNYVLNRYLCIPIFLCIMYIIFKFTFFFSTPVVNLFVVFFKFVSFKISTAIASSILKSFIIDGIIGGLGGVLSFFPILLFMFFAIAFFEDLGYMARASFIMDKLLSRFGLTGKSFLPLMIATNGCAGPGIIATRILESKRERILTMLIVPFMICGAKFPVCMFVIRVIFAHKYQSIVMFLLYIFSILIALTVSKILSSMISQEHSSHFIMELPPYHLPKFRGLLLKMWERSWIYIRKAWTIVIFTSIFVWSMSTLTYHNKNVLDIPKKILNPLFTPIGLDGNKAISLLTGIIAKEIVISTLNLTNCKDNIYLHDNTNREWDPLQGITFLIFFLTYIPCITSILIFCKEVGKKKYKWLIGILFGNTILAWSLSFIVFNIGTVLSRYIYIGK
ncbi:MAG: ferrous iron transport protein B [Endomicrobium sp.]|jgi:ferrous iron transport protein B|nr:ferrous iron transport protein B [Endomicrobium sp.]